MEQYSRQFIEELAKHIDPAIADFFNMKHEIFKFPAKTFTELIDETLMDYLEGKTSREDLIPIVNKIKKSRLQKRARWYKSYINDVDMVLVMTVHPGFGGQSYIDDCTDKVKVIREKANSENKDLLIQVDGGITTANVETPIKAGANVIVAGSAVYKGDVEGNIKNFKEIFENVK